MKRGGGILHFEGERGAPPEQACTPFVRSLIQEMGGNPQDLRRPPLNARLIEGEGVGGEIQGETGVGLVTPPQIGGRGAPEEQARDIVARIINVTPGGGPHSGQTPENPQRARHTRGDREVDTGGEGEETDTGREGGEGKESATEDTPPLLPCRRASRQRDEHPAREREETAAEEETVEEEGDEEEEKARDRETPRGDPVEVTCMGGDATPPQRKTRTSRDSPQNVRTCCCRKSMETFCITTTGRTWTGE